MSKLFLLSSAHFSFIRRLHFIIIECRGWRNWQQKKREKNGILPAAFAITSKLMRYLFWFFSYFIVVGPRPLIHLNESIFFRECECVSGYLSHASVVCVCVVVVAVTAVLWCYAVWCKHILFIFESTIHWSDLFCWFASDWVSRDLGGDVRLNFWLTHNCVWARNIAKIKNWLRGTLYEMRSRI